MTRPVAGSSLQLIRQFYNASKVDEPIDPSDARWVDLAPVRGSGGDLVRRLLRQVTLEEGFIRLLVTGFRGTGKTSLLRACRLLLRTRATGWSTLTWSPTIYGAPASR